MAYWKHYNATRRDPEKQRAYYESVKDTPAYKRRSKAWREQNREHLLGYFRVYNATKRDPEKQRAYRASAHAKENHRAWCKAHREQRLASKRKSDALHREARRAGNKAWRLKNLAHVKAKAKAYDATHKAEKQAYMKAYYNRNYQKRYALYAQASTKRRALKLAATVNLKGIRAFMDSVKSKPFATCYYCGDRVSTKGRALHFDHIVSLSQGGQHTVDNLCVSCASCNLSKHAKPLAEWLKTMTGQQLLTL